MREPACTRRSTLPHARTRSVELDVHQDAIAGASGANDHDAAVLDLGTMGPRHCALDPLGRPRPANATHLVFVDAAGPGGSGRWRSLPNQGPVGWVVAPSRMPHKAGARVNTARRDAVLLARLLRAGDRTRLDVPTVAARRGYPKESPTPLLLPPPFCNQGVYKIISSTGLNVAYIKAQIKKPS